jgi:hypothetical protein
VTTLSLVELRMLKWRMLVKDSKLADMLSTSI